MSRANNSAQMAGSSLDRYIGYLTTMTDVTQKSAASIGESMKTVYSRFQNIAAGKFVAAESDIESENYNEEDWANLNDVEKALGALGIKIRDSVDNFRNFDDVIDEIASKWSSFSDVQQSGIATALAGTRQRENLITLFENFDLVQKYEQIAANSYGTAAQKMEAYTDSMEAARTRMTASLEKWTLALDGSKALKVFYNAVADVSDNLVAWSTSIIAMMALTNTAGVGTGIQNGLGKIWSVLANSQISSMNRQETFANYWGKGGMGGVWARIKENIEGDFLASQKEVFSKSLNATIKNMDALSESAKTMLSDGMVPLQNTLLNMTAGDKEFYGKLLASGEALDKYRISTVKGMLQRAGNSAVEAVLGTVTEAEKNTRLAAIEATNGGKVEEAKLQYATELLADERNKAARQQIGQDLLRSSQMNAKKAAISNAITGGLSIGGIWLGNTVGEALGGGTGQAIGSLLGMSLGNSLGSSISAAIAAIPKGATFGTAMKTLWTVFASGVRSIAGPLLIAAIPIVIAGVIKKAKNKVKEEAANLAKEASETYTNTLNASAEAVNFDKLVNGVDYLGRNVSLTDEEYQSFLESSNALAEVFPELVVRTDELGNKFVGPNGLSGQVGEVTEKINELTEASRKVADIELFKQRDVTVGTKVGTESGFSNVFDEQKKIIDNAKKQLKNNSYTVGGNGISVTGLDAYITAQEKYLNSISGGKDGKNSQQYQKAEKQLEKAKLQRDNLIEELEGASDTLADYTEQLVSYANTASGQLSFGGQFGELEDQLNNMSDESKNLVLSTVKLSISDIDFENETDYETKVLELTQKLTNLFEENPVLVDFYYNKDTGVTIQEAQKAREEVLKALKAAFPDGVFDPETVEILIKMGFVVDKNGNIHVEDIKTRFAKALGVDSLSDGWSNFIDGLTDSRATLLYNEIQNGSIRYNPNQDRDNSENYFANMSNWLDFKEYSSKSASDLASDYETLSRMIQETDDAVEKSKLEKRLKLTKEYLDGYAEQLGTVKGNYDEIIEKINIMNGDLDRYGVSNATPDEVIDKGDKYQALLDYFNSDFTGTWNPEKLSEVANDSALAPYIDNIDKLKEVLKGYVDDMETYYNNALGNILIQSEGGSQYLIGLHEDEVNAFNEAYGVDLRNYKTLEEARGVVEQMFFTDYQEDMVDWLTNNATKYGLDLEEFSTMMGQKMALVSAFAQMLGQSNQDVERTINGYLQTHAGATLQDAYDYIWQGKIHSDMTKMQEEMAKIFDPGVKTSFDSTKTKKGSGSKDNSFEDQLSAMKGIYQKEYYLRKSYKDFGNVNAGSEASYMNKTYYAGLKNIYELESKYYASKIPAGKAITEYTSEELGYLQKYQEAQINLNNLDDEEWEDRINILELQGASLEKLIEANKEYEKTSDSLQEHIERQKKILELEIQQLELHKEVSEWQRDNTDRLIDRLSGDAFSNDAYDRAIGQQVEAVNDEIADTQSIIQKYYAEAVNDYEQTGHSHAEALRLAYTGNNEYSEKLRSAMTDYYNLIDKRTEYTIKKMEDKADDLNRRLDLIEKEKPDEWFKIGDIDSYYTQRMDLLQKQVELYQDALKDTSDMTDEQIQNIVDSLNEATLSLKQAQIDNLKDQTDLQSKQYDAIVYRINLWKDEIQDAIDAIEDAYEDEIKPIQDVSDELERQAKLEDLLAAKKAAAKQKERVALNALYKNGYISQKPEMVKTQERLKTIINYFKRKEEKTWRVFIKLQQKIPRKDFQKVIQDKQLSHLKNENISIIEMQQN